MSSHFLFSFRSPPPPTSTLFPYTTLFRSHTNVIVARSMSKAYSLAGMRFGYAVADPALVHELVKVRSEEHTSELQSRQYIVCRLLLEKKKNERSKRLRRLQYWARRHCVWE